MKQQVNFDNYFSSEDQHPYDEVEWETTTASIKDADGEVLFEQEVEFPTFWSQQSINIVASKYFYGDIENGNGSPADDKREYSLKQLIDRVIDTITTYGETEGYFPSAFAAERFAREMKWLCLHQYAAFNSPVWFNVGLYQKYGIETSDRDNWVWTWVDEFDYTGVKKEDPHKAPQASACFIIDVQDTIDDIWRAIHESARLFKFGSGVGADWSRLRSTEEKLSGGGKPSGPVSFMRVQDETGGTIKSGGKTRRAAIMQTLRCDHPDVFDFATVKREEEAKAHALIEQGYEASFNGEAYQTVAFQNVNQSVRVTDEFMEALRDGEKVPLRDVDGNTITEYDPEDLMEEIARGTFECGDPGIQFDDIINDWNTVPNFGRIWSSNPCSEFLHPDNTACNLASLNLRKFEGQKRKVWDVEALESAARRVITAMEILVDLAGYPSEAIAENSHKLRPLGMGFANLGATLMANGIPYDSDEGRAVAAGLQSIIHFAGLDQSAIIAKEMGSFDAYEDNEDAMLGVVGKHLSELHWMKEGSCDYIEPDNVDLLFDYAEELGDTALARGQKHGYRNSQITVVAPTGTISFFMGCDTTGIEPSIGLVSYKLLAGESDSYMQIVNDSVEDALEALGYDHMERERVLEYIKQADTIEGSDLDEEDLPVFDCAFEPQNGERSIHHMGHIRMLAAVQPFVSGSISKTINMPAESTIEDIRDAYVKAWDLGLKCEAIYRDGSKGSQAVSTSAEDEDDDFVEDIPEIQTHEALEAVAQDYEEGELALLDIHQRLDVTIREELVDMIKATDAREVVTSLELLLEENLEDLYTAAIEFDKGVPERRKVPEEAESIRKKFRVDNVEGYIHVGLFDDGSPGEIFVNVSKAKPTIAGLLDQWAIALSIGLQYGVPLEKYVEKFKNVSFKPAGFTGGDEVCKVAQSVVDYVARYLEHRFVNKPEPVDGGIMKAIDDYVQQNAGTDAAKETTGTPCPECGNRMVQNGTCEVCPQCGETTGCG